MLSASNSTKKALRECEIGFVRERGKVEIMKRMK